MFFSRQVLFRSLAAATFLAAGTLAPAVRAAQAPAISAFDDAFGRIRDYTVTVTAHEVRGNDVQDRVYHYWFMKPHFAKIEVASGAGTGGGGVWAGGDRVSGHQGGFLSHFHLKVGLHDGRATSLRGYTIPDGLLQNEVDKYREWKGDLSQRSGPVIAGSPTDIVELHLANPSAADDVTRMDIYLSRATHMPVRQIRYQGDRVVAEENFSELKLNVGLNAQDFPF